MFKDVFVDFCPKRFSLGALKDVHKKYFEYNFSLASSLEIDFRLFLTEQISKLIFLVFLHASTLATFFLLRFYCKSNEMRLYYTPHVRKLAS